MPHFILEYSANLDNSIEFADLFGQLTDTAVATGVFPLAGIRCRAHRSDHYRIADGNPDFGFAHLQVKLGAGRPDEVKAAAAEAIFSTLSEYFKPLYETQGLALSFEMTELPVTLKYNHNNLRNYIANG